MKKNNGLAGMSFEQIMVQQARQTVEKPIFCRVCGQDVKKPSKHSPSGGGNWSKNIDWEIENHVHTSCAQKHMQQNRRR